MKQNQKALIYNLNDGDYYVVVRDAFIAPNKKIRVVFEVLSKQSPLVIYLAGKNYRQDTSQFATDLIGWLGLEQSEKLVKDGIVDLGALKGLKADITIENHDEVDKYEKPYSFVSRVKAPGTLVEAIEEAEHEEDAA